MGEKLSPSLVRARCVVEHVEEHREKSLSHFRERFGTGNTSGPAMSQRSVRRPSAHPSVHLPVRPSSHRPSYPSIHPSIRLPEHPSCSPPEYPSIHPSARPSEHQPTRASVGPSVQPSRPPTHAIRAPHPALQIHPSAHRWSGIIALWNPWI